MNKFISKLIYSNHIVLTFIRASLSSAFSAVIDLGSRIIFYSFVFISLNEFYRSNLSVAIGAIIGGIVQCTVNYKFTFHSKGQKIVNVAVKFIIVWAGNLLLNMYGTTYLLSFLMDWNYLREFNLSDDGLFAFSTFFIAIAVSVSWNFFMQRNFVYVHTKFDKIFNLRIWGN